MHLVGPFIQVKLTVYFLIDVLVLGSLLHSPWELSWIKGTGANSSLTLMVPYYDTPVVGRR
jgi:hypothetical protein